MDGEGGGGGCCIFHPTPAPRFANTGGFLHTTGLRYLLVCGGSFAVLGVHARFGLWDAVNAWDASEIASKSISIASPSPPPIACQRRC